jgi:hypothetical protein
VLLADALRACRLLFAVSVGEAAGVLAELDAVNVKRAYRRAARRTHPDLFGHLPERERARKAEAFIRAAEAYRILAAFVEEARAPLGSPDTSRRDSPESSHRDAGRQTHGGHRPLPHRQLRLGEFLVQKGIVSPAELARALAWQREAVPRLGQIAAGWRWIGAQAVEGALADRREGEFVGALLVRHGLLTPLRLRILLRHQLRVRPPLGGYFVEQGLLTLERLERYLRLQGAHNACCRLRQRRSTEPAGADGGER